jgi:hypothetical protein
MKKIILTAVLAVILSTVAALLSPRNLLAQTNAPSDTSNNIKAITTTPYPLATCVVSGEKLSEMGKPTEFIYTTNGVSQEIKFCCPDCKAVFLKDPDKYLKKIHDAEAAQK